MLSKTTISFFKPKQIVKFITDIDLNSLKKKNIEILLIDINDTIIPKNRYTLAFEFVNWYREAQERGLQIYLIANFIGKREKKIAEQLKAKVLAIGCKPVLFFMDNFLTKQFGSYNSQKIALIGDNFATDIFTGNILNYHTILVENSYAQSGQGRVSFLKNTYLKIINEKISTD